MSPGRYSSGVSDSASLAGGGGTSLLTLGEGSEGGASEGDKTADCASAISSSASEAASDKVPSEPSIVNGSGTSGSIACDGGLGAPALSPPSSGKVCS
jgi:hypothetical protein